jgi:mannose-6-phosphate isomerase-like protein (cupin superfamily)
MHSEAAFKKQFSKKLSRLRHQKRLTVDELSLESHIQPDLLNRYESGDAIPPIGDLLNLAKVFGIQSGYFFLSDPQASRVEIVRANDRWRAQQRTEASTALNYEYEALSYHMSDKVMLPFLIVIPPMQDKELAGSSHDGEEFLFILSGEIEIEIENEKHVLGKGDSVYFDSATSHKIRSVGAQPARLIACIINLTTPHSDEENPLMRAWHNE